MGEFKVGADPVNVTKNVMVSDWPIVMVPESSINDAVASRSRLPPGVTFMLIWAAPPGVTVPLPDEVPNTFMNVFVLVYGTFVIARLMVCPFRTPLPVMLRL